MAVRNLATTGLTIPPATAINAVATPRGLAAAGARSLVPVTYGVDRQPALILNVLPKAGDANTLLVQCLWGHALHQVDELRLNDQVLPSSSTVTSYTGSQTTADAVLVAAFAAQGITYSDTLAGFAYSVVAMPTRSFDGQLNISARLHGRVVYDPRRNRLPQAHGEGGSAGTPGALPAGMTMLPNAPAGLVRELSFGVEDDLRYVDVRLHGTSGYGGTIYFTWGAPAEPGQVCRGAGFARLAGGSLAGITGSSTNGLQARSGINAVLAAEYISYTLSAGSLRSGRAVTGSVTAPNGSAQWLLSLAQLNVTLGAAIDITVRIALPTIFNASADPLAWSDCPSLALADWSNSTLYGAGEPVLWSSVGPAADANDSLVGVSAPEKRRLLGVTLARDGASVVSTGEALRAYAGCWLVPTGNGLRLLPDADAAPAATYSHALGQIAGLSPLQLRDLGNVPTAVEVKFTDTSLIPWREASATATVPGAGSTKPWRISTIALPGVQRYSQALREAVERLNKLNLGDLSATIEVFDAGIAHDIGDIIEVTHPVGLAAKPLRVTDVDMAAAGRWRLAVSEHDPAGYSDEVVTAPSIADTNRTATGGPATAVTNFAGMVSKGRIVWVWAPAVDPSYAATELRTSDANWGQASPAPEFRGAANTWGQVVAAAGTYTLFAKHFDVLGNPSATAVQASVIVTTGDLVQDGAPGAAGPQGPAGVSGVAGTSVAEINAYIRSSSTPPSPTGGSFNFASQALTPPAGWSVGVPAGTDPVYVARGLASTGTPGATVTPTWGSAAAAFSDGQAVDVVFRRSAGTPATPGASAGVPTGWYATVDAVPAGSDPLWSSFGERSAPGSNWAWQAAVRVQGVDGAQGPQGPQGVAGSAGTSVAEVNVYIRSASAPGTPSGGSLNFSTQVLVPPSGWSVGVPAGADPAYVARGIATAATLGASATPTYSTPTLAFSDGQSVDVVYRRSASQPSTPAPTAGVPSGWYSTVAAVPAGSDPLWSSFGKRPSPVSNWTWEAPVRVQGVDGAAGSQGVQGPQGPQGVAGSAGTSVAELNVYIRSTSEPPAPADGVFNFTTLALTPPVGWSVGVPGGTDPVYVARGYAYTSTPGASVVPSWGSVAVAFADGQAVDVVFIRSSSQPATPSPSAGVPAGWYATVASVPAGDHPLWSCFGERSSINANWVWQAPVRLQGADGVNGAGLLTLVARGTAVVVAGDVTKPSGAAAWDGDAYSLEAYSNGAFCSFQAGQTSGHCMLGLNSDPLTNSDWSSLDFAWYATPGGFAEIAESGALITGVGSYTTTTLFGIVYDGATVRYLIDGVVMRTVNVGPGLKLHLDSSVNTAGSSIRNIRFGPVGQRGDSGAAAVALSLDRVGVTLTADSNGVVDAGQLPLAIVATVRLGAVDDTTNWDFTRGSTSGITTTILGSTVTITAVADALDSGTITFWGEKDGQTVDLTIPVTKAKRAVPNNGPLALFGSLEVVAGTLSPADATAKIQLETDGRITGWINGVSSDIGNWYLANAAGAGDDFEAKFDLLSISGSSTGTTSNATTGWGALSTARYVQVQYTTNSGIFTQRRYSIAIRRISDGVQVGSALVYLECAVEI